jgi:hypothetical protein
MKKELYDLLEQNYKGNLNDNYFSRQAFTFS